jgi:hypothetical protein
MDIIFKNTLSLWDKEYAIFRINTDNLLETKNKVIKDEYIFSERLTLSRFFTITNGIANK